ncbi:hypothetical protein A1L58_21785 [Shewanella baltica]|uniref:Peptidase S24/S26A/S26B/S26C domain-containing protein n=2 Tax=Shewanella TaxID=22 RepID=A9KZQ7_SHEB9|nr:MULTISPECIES: S24 family peptidase [Shewanella]ABX49159.1 hypothetical protein Sbal195_1988 [Shewanella baltica OS195]KZK66298.1 hypothetical protein A1L58_21785 [Shewanella baltica]MDT3282478.1 S24 family peptidase [Shewanella sp. SP2S1-2]
MIMHYLLFIPASKYARNSGFESLAAEYQQLSLSLDELLVQHPSSTYVEITEGDLMLGEGIYDGDLLIVDRHITAQHGADFILLIVNSRLLI